MSDESPAGANLKEQEEKALVAQIERSVSSEDVVQAVLKTDERVIARVTDGIYRQPGSALRELISNAYDADATRVVVKTDVPRFSQISIEDNGRGMSPQTLAHLLLHIGGSAKRNAKGAELGITSDDLLRSPKGRRLIGKIGIGLFSVSQLTHSFQIITKTEEDDYRTVATVALKQFGEDDAITSESKEFESGKVNIWREKASDRDAHGTSIILNRIRPQARDTLRSRELWAAIDGTGTENSIDERPALEPPHFHVGRVDSSGELLLGGNPFSSLPWEVEDQPDQAFSKLVRAVWNEVEKANPNPQLDRIFDSYLRMVWQLSLSIPLPYVEGHPFDFLLDGWVEPFRLSNEPKGAAERVEESSLTIRRGFGLEDPSEPVGGFEVYFDNLKLSRPIRFKNLPTTSHALKTPLIFIGKCRETFSKLPRELSGGPLAFEAYLFWNPKIAPTEHQGSLVRIHGASGTLFDPTFMRYQVAEQTRLRQLTCEVFVSEGLDSALNIDRESFNAAHPHAVFISKWLHSALRQFATAQKRRASEVRALIRGDSLDVARSAIHSIALGIWKEEADDPASEPPSVLFVTDPKSQATEGYAFSREAVLRAPLGRQTDALRTRATISEERLRAIAQVLASFSLLDSLPKSKQEKMLRAIFQILVSDE